MSKVDYDELNHTELVKLAHWVGMPNVSRAIPREMIVEALQNREVIDIPNPVDEKRDMISSWLRRNWGVLAMQVRKSECPDCTKCPDLQVVECYSDNRKYFGKK